MFLKSIRLYNIRSYLDQKIDFPLGSVLLAGDIGSGKSTILLAIEFALFGLKKGDLSGYSLLRHGKKDGFVELKIDIDGKEVAIKRTLKRIANDIKQETGYIIVGGVKKEGTAEELKAAMLQFMGYPKEFLKKKDLIYRYTVYTPQEEMKQIIYEANELRLDTLRKVFNIDRYKRIVENSKILIDALREKKKSIEGFIADLEAKKSELNRKHREIEVLKRSIDNLSPKIEDIKLKIKSKQIALDELDEKISRLNELKRDFDVLNANLINKEEQLRINNLRIENLESEIRLLKNEVAGNEVVDTALLSEQIGSKESRIKELEANYRNAIRKLQESKSNAQVLRAQINKITSLSICPLCEQNVILEHKHKIKLREEEKLRKLDEEVMFYENIEKNAESSLNSLIKERDLLRKRETENMLLLHKSKVLGARTKEMDKNASMQAAIANEIKEINEKKLKAYAEIEQFKDAEQQFKRIKSEFDDLIRQEKTLDIEKAKIEKELDVTIKILNGISNEVKIREDAKKELRICDDIKNWTEVVFTNLIIIIEKHALMQLHHEFSEVFIEWFNILIEDDTISVRLDDEFSPVIEQNGYETFIENLSGGEKTSVALAYRLALNKVINDIVSSIRTKDIIILDEPTDGFSTEQLDKVREVVELLNMKQVIIVSHESKIEGFVENVIKVTKEGHASIISLAF